MPLEVLHGTFVLLSGRAAVEGAELSPAPRVRIDLSLSSQTYTGTDPNKRPGELTWSSPCPRTREEADGEAGVSAMLVVFE